MILTEQTEAVISLFEFFICELIRANTKWIIPCESNAPSAWTIGLKPHQNELEGTKLDQGWPYPAQFQWTEWTKIRLTE